jgi:hypothetical protein
MNVLLINEYYPPVLNSASRLFSELQVTVLTDSPTRYLESKKYYRKKTKKEYSNGITIIRLSTFPIFQKFLPLRYIEQFFKMIQFWVAGLLQNHKAHIIIYWPPLPLAVAGIWLAKHYRTKAIVNVQDLYPKTPILLGQLKNRLIIAISNKMAPFTSDAKKIIREANCGIWLSQARQKN